MAYRVLIGDDSDQMRSLIAAILGPDGYELRDAAHGQEILDELARLPADLVILDLHMPGLDGLSVLRAIRADPRLSATRVLMITGDLPALDVRSSEPIQADASLTKPFEISVLTETVRRLLQS